MKIQFVFFSFLFMSVSLFSQVAPSNEISDSLKNEFMKHYPDANIQSLEEDSGVYVISFIQEKQLGKANYVLPLKWITTQFNIAVKELPTPVISHIKKNYNNYRIKNVLMFQEPDVPIYYQITIKKESFQKASSISLFYTYSGDFIRKEMINTTNEEEINIESDTLDHVFITKLDYEQNKNELIDKKELPSLLLEYIKTNYKGYNFKDSFVSSLDEQTVYVVRLKKDMSSLYKELFFDIKGHFIKVKD